MLYIVLFNGSTILWFNVGTVTSYEITHLTHLSAYLVMVIAINSEGEYSAAYRIHLLEAGKYKIKVIKITSLN